MSCSAGIVEKMKRQKGGRFSQRGAVAAEVVVLGSLVLVPMMILVPFIGKYADTRYKGEQAARYAAWERTAWLSPGSKGFKNTAKYVPFSHKRKKDQEINNEIQGRILGAAGTPVTEKQKTGKDAKQFDPLQHFVNRNNGGKYQILMREQGQTKHYTKLTMSDSQPSSNVSKTLNKMVGAISKFGSFDINTRGLYTSEVKVDVFEPSWYKEFANMDIVFTSKHMLYTDGWSAGGKRHNEEMVKGLIPFGMLGIDKINKATDFLGSLPGPTADLGGLELGKVDVDVLPLGRYEKTR